MASRSADSDIDVLATMFWLYGTVDEALAIRRGIKSVAARVYDLRKDHGFVIQSTRMSIGSRKSICRYWMARDVNKNAYLRFVADLPTNKIPKVGNKQPQPGA